jgi:predicted MFS family arabinose efflux permease
MPPIHKSKAAATVAPASELNKPPLLLLAAGAGFGVAALYYSQPILGVLMADMHSNERMVGLIPTLTQLGYALGILFLAPLGDKLERRRLILVKSLVLTLALLLCAAAPAIGWLLLASLVVGLSSTVAQDIVPAAAILAPADSRGKAVGTVMTGLLLGILLSRVVGGLVAEHLGWRTLYVGAALSIAVISVALWRGLPRFEPTVVVPYRALLGTMAALWRQHPSLRRAALAQGLLALGFSAFWSTLAVMLHAAPLHLGSAAAGAFGLAGVAGALAAPLAGRVSDRHSPQWVTRMGAALTALSFAAMAMSALLAPAPQVWLIVLGAVGFDFGVQTCLVAHQTIVYGLDPAARSRLNALLITGMFIGMSSGAWLGSQAYALWDWAGVVCLATLAATGALFVRLGVEQD